jgi:hypothetical protein
MKITFKLLTLLALVLIVNSTPIRCTSALEAATTLQEVDDLEFEVEDIEVLSTNPCDDKNVCVISCPPCGQKLYFDLGNVSNDPIWQQVCVSNRLSSTFKFSEAFIRNSLLEQLKASPVRVPTVQAQCNFIHFNPSLVFLFRWRYQNNFKELYFICSSTCCKILF